MQGSVPITTVVNRVTSSIMGSSELEVHSWRKMVLDVTTLSVSVFKSTSPEPLRSRSPPLHLRISLKFTPSQITIFSLAAVVASGSVPGPLLARSVQDHSSVLKNRNLIALLSYLKAFNDSPLPWIKIQNPSHGSA